MSSIIANCYEESWDTSYRNQNWKLYFSGCVVLETGIAIQAIRTIKELPVPGPLCNENALGFTDVADGMRALPTDQMVEVIKAMHLNLTISVSDEAISVKEGREVIKETCQFSWKIIT